MKKGILLAAVLVLMAGLSHAHEKAIKSVEKKVRRELGNPAGLVFKDSTFYGGGRHKHYLRLLQDSKG